MSSRGSQHAKAVAEAKNYHNFNELTTERDASAWRPDSAWWRAFQADSWVDHNHGFTAPGKSSMYIRCQSSVTISIQIFPSVIGLAV